MTERHLARLAQLAARLYDAADEQVQNPQDALIALSLAAQAARERIKKEGEPDPTEFENGALDWFKKGLSEALLKRKINAPGTSGEDPCPS